MRHNCRPIKTNSRFLKTFYKYVVKIINDIMIKDANNDNIIKNQIIEILIKKNFSIYQKNLNLTFITHIDILYHNFSRI